MKLKLTILLVAIPLILSSGIKAAKPPVISKKACAKVDKKITTLNSKMRAGYNLKQGEKMKAKLRLLDKQKYGCKRKRYPTK